MTLERRIEGIMQRATQMIRDRAPKDTGNLAFFAIRGDWTAQGVYTIWVEGSDGRRSNGPMKGVAPYMKYTNEAWGNFAPPLQGKTNPNEGWWDRAVAEVMDYIARELRGVISR